MAGQTAVVAHVTLVCKSRGKSLIWVVGGAAPKGSGNGTATGAGGAAAGGGQSPSAAQQAAPVFENLGVVFGPWDKGTNRAGDFLFTRGQSPAKGPVSEFADSIATGSGTKVTSEIGWDYLAAGTPVQALADGIVTAEKFQSDSNDYEVWEQTAAGSEWTIIYDHVQGLKVAQGAHVAAGTALGSAVGTGVPFFEIQVVQRLNDVNHQWCPTKFLDPGVRDTTLAAIRQLESDWQDFKGDRTIYNPARDVFTGCLQESFIGG